MDTLISAGGRTARLTGVIDITAMDDQSIIRDSVAG
jgi:hypothetical protein